MEGLVQMMFFVSFFKGENFQVNLPFIFRKIYCTPKTDPQSPRPCRFPQKIGWQRGRGQNHSLPFADRRALTGYKDGSM